MVELNEFYKGINKSRFEQTGFDNIVNADVFAEIGSAKCQRALAAVTETNVPTEPCYTEVDPSGNTYFFSRTSGKAWKRNTSGTYSLVNTNTKGTAHYGCKYYNGYIYYSTDEWLGRYNLASTWDDDFAQFTNVTSYRPMVECNLKLYIGNAKYVASVDNSTPAVFNDNALDLPAQHAVLCLENTGTELIIGTYINAAVHKGKVFLWDTYSDSWLIDDDVNEIGVNCFIKADNVIIAQCGTGGALYFWNGRQLQKFYTIRGVATIRSHNLSTVLNGRALYACDNKIFSIHRQSEDMTFSVTQEYTSTGTLIRSIVSNGDNLFVSHDAGVDYLDGTRATAQIDTYEMSNMSGVEVGYSALPSGTSIGISVKTDGGAWTTKTAITDTIRKVVYFDGGVGKCNFGQGRATLNPSSGSTPVVTYVRLL